jgi:hypothetical protein
VSDPIAQLKHELLAAADRRQAAVQPDEMTRRIRRPNRLVLMAAAVTIAAAATLVANAPWTNSVNVLEKAQAALTAPGDTVLHEKWEVTSISAEPQCTVTRGPSEIWIDQTPPHRYRALLNDLAMVDPPLDLDAPPGICTRGAEIELGGVLDLVCFSVGCEPTLRFVRPNSLRVMPVAFGVPADTAALLREAISAGHAHHEGKTELAGRAVERIRLDPPPDCRRCPREPGYAYVDPETFYPVEFRSPALGGVRFVTRFLTYEYLPRTPANLALTDIRAQHPSATETGEP